MTNFSSLSFVKVASQCLESAYEISIDDAICKDNFDSGLNLVEIAEKSVIKVTYQTLLTSYPFFYFSILFLY